MAKGFAEFVNRMNEDPAFAEEVKAAGERIAKDEENLEERELTVKVGEELGYEFTMGDIERSIADDQELDREELAKAVGGLKILKWCWGESHNCFSSVKTGVIKRKMRV